MRAVADDDRVALRYAVASNVTPAFYAWNRIAAHAGSRLLVVADCSQSMSSPGSASAIAVEELRRLDVITSAPDLSRSLERGVESLRETLHRLLAGDRQWEGTGTSLAAMLWRGTHAAIAHIGSTRAYMLRGGGLTRLTRDHSLGQLLLEAGLITPDEMGSDPGHANILVRWLDGQSSEPADVTAHEAAIGDRYVLCTGIDRIMPERVVLDIARNAASSVQELADELAGTASPAAAPYHQFTCIVADAVEQPR
jgi:protein phosphatase